MADLRQRGGEGDIDKSPKGMESKETDRAKQTQS